MQRTLMPFEFERLEIPDIILVKPRIFSDERGFFAETYKKSEFIKAGIKEEFIQDNHSRSKRNVLRGLHFQKEPEAQGKLVNCVMGKIWDVAADIRPSSPSYKKWIAVELSEENGRMLYVPAGFAHGFVVLSDWAGVVYKCTREYSPEHDGGVIWNDPEIGIRWPVENPVLSKKDGKLPSLASFRNAGGEGK